MNQRIKELMAGAVTFHLDPDSNAYEAQVSPEDLELFAELLLTDAFKIIKEAMIDSKSGRKVDEIIADRLDDAAGDVCDQLGLLGPIYEG
jgi:hypothetical protein